MTKLDITDLKVVGIVSVFNEEDIILEMIEHSLSQGIELVILDNGSTDSTLEICNKFADEGLIKLFTYKCENFEWTEILRMVYHMALRESPDWLVHIDADEFLESGISNLTLKDAITEVDRQGYNLIQFNEFQFFMTDVDISSESIKKKFMYYSFVRDFLYRAWKYYPGIRVESAGGHLPVFPQCYKYKIYPKKFTLRHYMFRSKKQFESKIQNRIVRTEGTFENKIGWHTHYRKILDNKDSLIVDHRYLTKYEENNQWNEEPKFSYHSLNPPKREDIFSSDGELKKVYPTEARFGSALRDSQKNVERLKKLLQTQNKEYKKN